VFVRELSTEEGARLKSISKRAKYQSKRQRAMILLASSTGMSAPQIAAVVRSDESYVRKVIHAFNERGFSSLDPDYWGGRPQKTTPVQRDRIVAVARARPDRQGVPLTRWSLPKLQQHLAGIGIVFASLTLMTARSSRVRAYAQRLAAALILALTAALLAGCGSTSSSTTATSTSSTAPASTSSTAPASTSSTAAYCPEVNNFKSAVAQLKDKGSPSAIISSIKNVYSTGQMAISAVKTAFPPQTAALKSSLTTLHNSIKQLTNSSTRASALQQLPGQVTAVKTAGAQFVDATKCG
jgi:transposase